MQDELCGFVDLDEVVGIVWEVVRKLKLQPLRNAQPEIGLEPSNKSSTLFGGR